MTNPALLVGSFGVRLTALFLFVVTIVAVTAYVNGMVPRTGAMQTVVIVSALVTFMAFVHTTTAIYVRWLRFAEGLHTVVISVLFGGIYLLIVPIFALLVWPFDVLRLRKRSADTFWIEKRRAGADLRHFERMG
jgi:hypothetical protein